MTPQQHFDQLWLLLMLSGYFLPTITAWVRAHPGTNSIAVINLFLGWTGLGWVLALAWAVYDRRQNNADMAKARH